MLGVFAVMALLLALGGSYGVTSISSRSARARSASASRSAPGDDISRTVVKGSLGVVAHRRGGRCRRRCRRRPFLASLLYGVTATTASCCHRRRRAVLDRCAGELGAGAAGVPSGSDGLAARGLKPYRRQEDCKDQKKN